MHRASSRNFPSLARPNWRRQLEQRRALRFTGRQLQQLAVEREHEHWRVVRV